MRTIIQEIDAAAHILAKGGLVAFPTETVYGIGADAGNEQAVHNIFAAKNRPLTNPLIVHLAGINQLTDWARDIPDRVWQLADAFWPGPLTIILKKQPHVLDAVTGCQDTIGLRIPAHPIAQKLLRAFGGGIAAPSANLYTHISTTTAAAVVEELSGRVDMIIDGGECQIGLESTILNLSDDAPSILRPGMISAQEIEATLGIKLSMPPQTLRAPGMHHLHYAPTTKTILLSSNKILSFLNGLQAQDFPIALLTCELEAPHTANVHVTKMPNDPKIYAHQLYDTLRQLDHQHYQHIIIEAVPHDNAWVAIHDRLSKASAPRS